MHVHFYTLLSDICLLYKYIYIYVIKNSFLYKRRCRLWSFRRFMKITLYFYVHMGVFYKTFLIKKT